MIYLKYILFGVMDFDFIKYFVRSLEMVIVKQNIRKGNNIKGFQHLGSYLYLYLHIIVLKESVNAWIGTV